ncbi:hypothetical protein DY923_15635 [Salmonella enterica subsp. enterica serovar Montevideo]|nr:hypothetical protein [Salmonella enterica subsp. enterica serovar Montevideo]MBB7293309.1 hypothetical protein [Escherichia coli]EDO6330094.1 hypothetical protein [Salmonella enterica subsp. enterica serovar Montevideo]EEA5725139.1 hypothetical protein [Salmonella enterica subsp. enterica serovar Montevideo]EGO1903795.1 hypothetical protein [Salmonella enterica subsp. enterica serovar Montevideo]
MKRIFGWSIVLVTLFTAYKIAGSGGLILSLIPLTIFIAIFANRHPRDAGSQGVNFQESVNFDDQEDIILPIPDASDTGSDWRGIPY